VILPLVISDKTDGLDIPASLGRESGLRSSQFAEPIPCETIAISSWARLDIPQYHAFSLQDFSEYRLTPETRQQEIIERTSSGVLLIFVNAHSIRPWLHFIMNPGHLFR
jgi:hypothetical protein